MGCTCSRGGSCRYARLFPPPALPDRRCFHADVTFTAFASALFPQAARAGEDCDGYRPTSYYESQRRSLDGFMSQPVQVRWAAMAAC